MNQAKNNLAALNKLVITTIVCITAAATMGNTIGVFKGEKSLPSTILFLIIGIATIANNLWAYKKDPSSERIKHHGCIGFLVMYLLTVLSTPRNIVFIYVIPLMYIYTMYYDLKLMKRFAAAFVCISVIAMVNLIVGHKLVDSNDIMNYVVQSIATIVVAITSVLTCKLTNQFNQDNVRQLTDANEKQQEILEEVLAIGGILDSRAKETYAIVSELQDSSATMTQAMDAMTMGMEKTSESIENQTYLSKEIQHSIANTSSQAMEMDQISNQSITKIEKGVSIVKELTEHTKSMNGSSMQVAAAMDDLREKTKEIDRITEVITSIAKKINILSLNASIESARAGEAGKGFAVVATEIGTLAAQTTKSIAGISSIILELQSVVENAIGSLQNLGQVHQEQNSLIHSTEEVFVRINADMGQVNQMVSSVTNMITQIYEANEKMMVNTNVLSVESLESKQNIESSTYATEKNLEQVEQAKKIADELLAAAERLQNYM